jgi:cell division protein ZapA (FtsZ GTPase activity inhibitor)
MAITRAQQFKQMLQEGGRIGFQRGGRRGDYGQASYSVSDSFTGPASTKASAPPSMGFGNPPDDRPSKDDDAGMPQQPTLRPRPKPIIKPDSEGPDFGPYDPRTLPGPKTTAQKKALQNYLNQVDLAMYGKDPLVIGDEEDADSIDDLLTSGTDATKLLEGDKRQELVESYVNQPINLPDFPGSTSLIANAFKNQLQKNAANLRQGIVDLSDRFSKERIVDYPKFMTKDGKQMSFDANLRTKSNLLSNLLDSKKKELGLKGDSKTGRISLFDLSTKDQKEVGKKVLDARLQGLTDAAGNFKAGVRIEKIPFRKADGTIEMRDQIIDNRDDRGGGRSPDPATITSNPELLKLQKQNKDLENQLAQQDQNRLFRLMAEGGMTEDAPVGGIMDLESGRQMYFLGKLVKKATRAVKKIVKSPLGKAALIGGLGYLGFKGMGGASGLSKFLFKEGGKGLPFGELLKGGLTGGGMLALGGALTAAPLLFGRQEDDDDTIDPALLGPTINIQEILANPYRASLGMNFRRTAADGGRMGLNQGTTDFMDFVRSMGMSQSELQDLDINSYNAILQAYEKAKEGEKPVTKRADGGRIGFQEGGIFPRLNQLSGSVSSAEQMLQDINQRLQSAESSLGGGKKCCRSKSRRIYG